jgi:hypothetical protein
MVITKKNNRKTMRPEVDCFFRNALISFNGFIFLQVRPTHTKRNNQNKMIDRPAYAFISIASPYAAKAKNKYA